MLRQTFKLRVAQSDLPKPPPPGIEQTSDGFILRIDLGPMVGIYEGGALSSFMVSKLMSDPIQPPTFAVSDFAKDEADLLSRYGRFAGKPSPQAEWTHRVTVRGPADEQTKALVRKAILCAADKNPEFGGVRPGDIVCEVL